MRSIPVRRSTRGVRRKLLLLAVAGIPVVVATGTAPASAAGANGPCVGGPHCYQTLQAAIDAAHDGDTIHIGRGSFAGGVTIAQSVNLWHLALRDQDQAAAARWSRSAPADDHADGHDRERHHHRRSYDLEPAEPDCGPDVPTCGPGYADATALGGGIEAFPGTTVTILQSKATGNQAAPGLPRPASRRPARPVPARLVRRRWRNRQLGHDDADRLHRQRQPRLGRPVERRRHRERRNASLTLKNSRVAGNTASASGAFARFVSGGGIFVDGGGTLRDRRQRDRQEQRRAHELDPPPLSHAGRGHRPGQFRRRRDLPLRRLDRDTPQLEPRSQQRDRDQSRRGAVRRRRSALRLRATSTSPSGTRASTATRSSSMSSRAPTPARAGRPPSRRTPTSSIDNARIAHNNGTVTTPTGDAAALGTVAFFFGGSVTPTITNSTISNNSVTTNAPGGAASIQGVGISNNGPLVLTGDVVNRNRGIANGTGGLAQGGGIWNGVLFGGPDSPLTLDHSRVTHNSLSGGPGVTLQGGGIFTPGFRAHSHQQPGRAQRT